MNFFFFAQIHLFFFLSSKGKGEIQTYWLSGVKENYFEQTNGINFDENSYLNDYHPTMYEITEKKPSLSNIINKRPSMSTRCPFSGI